MNGQEIIELLKCFMEKHNVSVNQLRDGEYDMEPEVWEELQTLTGGMEFWDSSIERESGDQVEEVVFKFKKHKVYLAFVGWYSSWDASNFDNCEPEIVVPARKTISYWKRVDE